VAADPPAWTQFDPNLRIEEYSNETSHVVVVTHLPTGMQASCGKWGGHILNRAAAIEQLKLKVVGE
jgi:protein subunit release factor A